MRKWRQATYFRIAVGFLMIVVVAATAMSIRTHASFTNTTVTITALIGVFALYFESRRGKNIAMGEFIINLNSEFDENPGRAKIHQKIIAGERIVAEDKPAIVAYLSFFEIIYRLVDTGVLRMDVIDDLFRSRFFKAAYHVDVQDLELLPDADGYLNVYELERRWLSHLARAGHELKRGDRPLPKSARRRAVEQVRFSFAYASQEDVGDVHELVVEAAAGTPREQFVVNDAATIARQMEDGFTVVAYNGSDAAGILHVHFPPDGKTHALLAGDDYPSSQVAHVDIGAVLPRYRGYGLLELLLIEAEMQLRANEPQRTTYYATVHPENGASVRSFEFSGYRAIDQVVIHGSYPRILFRKDVAENPQANRRVVR